MNDSGGKMSMLKSVITGLMVSVGAGMCGYYFGKWGAGVGAFLLIIGLDIRYEERGED